MALTDRLTAIGNAIRTKTGKTDKMTLAEMPGEIEGIETGGGFPNGTEWTQSANNIRGFTCLVYGDGVFAGQASYNGRINFVYSMDGKTWRSGYLKKGGSIPTNNGTCTYANGLWVMGISNADLYYSMDGKSWETKGAGLGGYYEEIVYGNGVWVATTSTGAYYSSDGKTWAEGGAGSVAFRACAFGNGKFIALTKNAAYHSTDGNEWTMYSGTSNCNAIVYARGLWVAAGDSLYYSEDGQKWTNGVCSWDNLRYVTYSDGLWVACRAVDNGTSVLYSEDGKAWSDSNITGVGISCATKANGVWVAGSSSNLEKGLYYSVDGKTWVASNITSDDYEHITYGNGIWVAGSGSMGKSLYSVAWEPSA